MIEKTKNTIAERVADNLKRFPPFDLLSEEKVIAISRQVTIRYLEKGQVIYRQNEQLHDEFYMIHKGSVLLKQEIKEVIKIIDKFEEGDVFGLRPIFARENYKISSIADEESILYAIPIEVFKPIIEENKEVGQFLIESFASNTDRPYSREYQRKFYLEEDENFIAEELFELQAVRYNKKVITAKPNISLIEIARLISTHKIGSVIIEENKVPVGIITIHDIIERVAEGSLSDDVVARDIMTSPVLCYPKGISLSQAQITMMKHEVSHICITKDGTPNTKIIGVLSEHDIIVMKGRNPSVLMWAIKRSNSTKELKRIRAQVSMLLDGYIQQNIPLTLSSKIIFELNDATIKRIIERCIEKMGSPPPVKFAWMSLGSQGRKEQLLHSDQDNAIIFENVSTERIEEVRNYFLTLAKKVNKRLDRIGFAFCPAEIMAKNSDWCLSLDEWKEKFLSWTQETSGDDLLKFSIFFDGDISYGDSRLSNGLFEYVFTITESNSLFMAKLASSSLRSPSPLGFFRQFLIERDGAMKDRFDLKNPALMPITDAGRVLAIRHQIKNINNTAERFEKLAELNPANRSLFLDCSYATKALIKFRTKHGLLNNDNGQYIQLAALTKEEKMKLKRCFKTITRIQDFIKLDFAINAYI